MAVAPPILDIFVVWHPEELGGADLLRQVQDHFHSPAFSGLAGGAVEVYGRSAPWGDDGAPRPLGIGESLAPEVRSAQFNVVLFVVGSELARAVRTDDAWRGYVENAAALGQSGEAFVFSLIKPGFSLDQETSLAESLGPAQPLDRRAFDDSGVLGREISQAVTQGLNGGERIQVFISHTKHPSLLEIADRDGAWIYDRVREAVLATHLDDFFDAQDIQVGDDWRTALDVNAGHSALLMVRTDSYAGREWTQREVFEAKRHDVPIVCMYALTDGEERGSFLMDHLPSVPCDLANPEPGIEVALNRLVDEALKRELWMRQRVYLLEDGFDWLPVHAPEPVTLATWLRNHQAIDPADPHVWVMHPDPPLGPREREVVIELFAVAGYGDRVDVVTPRTFAARGGKIVR